MARPTKIAEKQDGQYAGGPGSGAELHVPDECPSHDKGHSEETSAGPDPLAEGRRSQRYGEDVEHRVAVDWTAGE